MMIIINARFLTQRITGVQRYAIEMSRALKKIDPTIRFFAPHNIMHHDIANELGVEVVGRLSGHAWEQIELPSHLRANCNPLLLSLATTGPILYKRKIVTVHDLSIWHYPKAVSWKFRMLYQFLLPRVVASSLHITTVSNFCKNDIAEKFRASLDHLSVTYNASSFSGKHGDTERENKRVLIAVGSLQPYKNIIGLIEAFRIFKESGGTGYVLKLVGGIDRNVFKHNSLVEMIDAADDIEMTGYVSDEQLLELYGTATAFVFPSLFEGFGLPPLEAMACGCPVIASNAASIPEVCGDAAVYFDPNNAKEMAQRIHEVVDSAELRKKMSAAGYANATRFGWDKSARLMYGLAQQYGG